MIFVGGRSYRMGATSVDLVADPFTVTSNATGEVVETGPGVAITGTAPPSLWSSWWPWILLAGAALAVWWIAKDEDKGGGAASEAPFVG